MDMREITQDPTRDSQSQNFDRAIDFERQSQDRAIERQSPVEHAAMVERSAPVVTMDFVSEMHNRMTAIEETNRQLRADLDKAKRSGEVDFDFAHAAHVLNKHFYHDRPDDEKPAVPVAKFDPYTGQALN